MTFPEKAITLVLRQSKFGARDGQVHLVTLEGSVVTTPDFDKEGAEEALSLWLYGHSIPPLVQFSADRFTDFAGPIRVHALLFIHAEAKHYTEVTGVVKEALTPFRTQV